MRFFRRPGFFAAGALTVLLLLFWLRVPPLDDFFATVTRVFVTPIFRLQQRPADASARENQELRALVQTMAGDRALSATRATATANETALAAWASAHAFPLPISAVVLTRMNDEGGDDFLINRGERDGVRDGAVVMAGGGMLVGRIRAVRETTAILRLFFARGERFSLVRENGGAPIGITDGTNRDEIVPLAFVPKEESLALHDILITSGLDANVPRGLLVGTIRDLAPEDAGPWQRVFLRPFIAPADLTTVGILRFP